MDNDRVHVSFDAKVVQYNDDYEGTVTVRPVRSADGFESAYMTNVPRESVQCGHRSLARDIDGTGWAYCELPKGHDPVKGTRSGHHPSRFVHDPSATPGQKENSDEG